MVGSLFSIAIFCARITFLAVIGKNAPAFTVAALAMSMHKRPQMRARPVIVPAEGAPPHSSYISNAAKRPSSKKCVLGSINFATRSRAVRRPFLCCDSTAFGPPPWQMISSWFFSPVRSSMMWREFFLKSAESRLMEDFRVDADTQVPHIKSRMLVYGLRGQPGKTYAAYFLLMK